MYEKFNNYNNNIFNYRVLYSKKKISVSRNVLKAGCVIWYENASKATFRSVYIIVYFDVNEVKIIRSSINTLLHVVTIMTLNFFLKYPYVCTIMH